MRRSLLCAVLLLLALPAGANAELGTWSLSEDGQPRIDRSAVATPSDVYVCAPGCSEVASAPTVYEPGETAAGTTFEVRYAGGRVDRSPVWQGAIAPQSPPAIDGDATEGAVVRPFGGEWSGGWADDVSQVMLYICRSQEGQDCRALPAANAAAPVPVSGAGSALLPPGSAGGYLFAVDTRVARDASAVPVPALYSPDARYELPLPGARTLISLPLGPVAPVPGAPAPPTATPTPEKPSAKLRKRAYRKRGRVIVGTVTCAERCRVQLRVGKQRRDIRVQGTKRLEIIRGKKLRKGRLKVTVRIDGTLVASGRVRLRY